MYNIMLHLLGASCASMPLGDSCLLPLNTLHKFHSYLFADDLAIREMAQERAKHIHRLSLLLPVMLCAM